MSTLHSFGSQSVTGWAGMVEHLKKANEEYRATYGIMTPYERASIGKSIAEKREEYRQAIEAGVIGQHTAAIQNLQAKLAYVESERRAVTNSWEAGELSAQMQVYNMRIEAAARNGDRSALEAIYQEAKDSGDRYKQRAAAEAMQGAVKIFPGDAQDIHGEPVRKAVNRLEKQSARDLESLRTSPDLQAAHQAAAEAVEGLNNALKQIYQAAEVMGEVAPNGNLENSRLIKAVERVTQDGSGNFQIKEN